MLLIKTIVLASNVLVSWTCFDLMCFISFCQMNARDVDVELVTDEPTMRGRWRWSTWFVMLEMQIGNTTFELKIIECLCLY